jgi:hypothetical protein
MIHSSPSPVHSMHRKLSHRRGSVSAPDPYGVHAETNLDPGRSCASTLTIVRLTPVEPAPQFTSSTSLKLNDPPLAHRRPLHRRGGGPGGNSSYGPGGGGNNGESPRLSFAFSSFAGSGPALGGPSSPSGSRPTSPTLTRSNSGGAAGGRPSSPTLSRPGRTPGPQPRLPPEQLVELAKQSTTPRLSSSSSAAGTPASSPSLHRPHSPRLSFSGGSVADEHHVPAPAKFTPMAFDVYLPFLDRPAEVLALISSPPSAKLFSLLKQTFPVHASTSNSETTTSATTTAAPGLIEAPASPAEWTYDQLYNWLTTIPREEADDQAWVRAARICIRSHSELIWERVKGALGVPPELDEGDEEEDEFEDPFLTDEEEDPVLLPPTASAASAAVAAEITITSAAAIDEHEETTAAAQGDTNANPLTQEPLADGTGLESSRLSLDDGAADFASPEISIEPIFATPTTGACSRLQETRHHRRSVSRLQWATPLLLHWALSVKKTKKKRTKTRTERHRLPDPLLPPPKNRSRKKSVKYADSRSVPHLRLLLLTQAPSLVVVV